VSTPIALVERNRASSDFKSRGAADGGAVAGAGAAFGATDGEGIEATAAGGAGGTAWLCGRLAVGAFATGADGVGAAAGGRVTGLAATGAEGDTGTTGAAREAGVTGAAGVAVASGAAGTAVAEASAGVADADAAGSAGGTELPLAGASVVTSAAPPAVSAGWALVPVPVVSGGCVWAQPTASTQLSAMAQYDAPEFAAGSTMFSPGTDTIRPLRRPSVRFVRYCMITKRYFCPVSASSVCCQNCRLVQNW